MSKYNEDAVKWISSLSGFQGGNPSSELWFCGLEYQDCDLDIIKYPNRWSSVHNPPFVSVDEYLAHPEHGGDFFNSSLCHIAEAYYGMQKDEILKNPFGQDSNIFKLNLYPLPQKSTGEVFKKDIYNKTGILTKSELRTICIDSSLPNTTSRFDNFKKLLRNNNGKVKAIIGCSRQASDTFLLAFAEREEFYVLKKKLDVKHIICEDNRKRKNYYGWCRPKDGPYIFIIPFMGGANPSFRNESDMIWMGKRIKEIIQKGE